MASDSWRSHPIKFTESKELQLKLDQFLEAGGIIEVIPPGQSIPYEELERRRKARAADYIANVLPNIKTILLQK